MPLYDQDHETDNILQKEQSRNNGTARNGRW